MAHQARTRDEEKSTEHTVRPRCTTFRAPIVHSGANDHLWYGHRVRIWVVLPRFMLREGLCLYRVTGSGIFPGSILSSFCQTLGRSVGPMCRLFVNRKRTITYIFVFRSAFTWLIDSIRPRTFCRPASFFYNARTDIGIAAFLVITQLALLGTVSLVIAEGSADTSKSLRGVGNQYDVSSEKCVCPLLRFDIFWNVEELCSHAHMEPVPMC